MIVTHLLRVGLKTEGIEMMTDEESANGIIEAYNAGVGGRRCVEGRTQSGGKTVSSFDLADAVAVVMIELNQEHKMAMAEAQGQMPTRPAIVRPDQPAS